MQLDCDGDTLLMQVDPVGPACHTGAVSCFFDGPGRRADLCRERRRVLACWRSSSRSSRTGRRTPLAESYTAKLLQEGVGRVAQKVVEEAGESAIAAVQGEREALAGEVADLLYHTLTLLAAADVSPRDVWAELAKRRK